MKGIATLKAFSPASLALETPDVAESCPNGCVDVFSVVFFPQPKHISVRAIARIIAAIFFIFLIAIFLSFLTNTIILNSYTYTWQSHFTRTP